MHFYNRFSTHLLAAISIILANLFFVINDVLIKSLSLDYPLHEIVFIRAVGGLTIMIILLSFQGGLSALRTRRPVLHMLRALMVIIANMAFFLSLATVSLGEATALFFVSPIIIILLSGIMLGEKINLRKLIGVFVGMAGVLFIVKPGFSVIHIGFFLPLIAAFAYALLQILNRMVGLSERAVVMVIFTQLGFLTVSSCFGLIIGDGRFANPDNPTIDFLARQWIIPENYAILLMLCCVVVHCLASYFSVQAYRMSEASFIAPMEYIALIFAVLLGVWLWQEWPDYIDFFGMLLISLGGVTALLYSYKRRY